MSILLCSLKQWISSMSPLPKALHNVHLHGKTSWHKGTLAHSDIEKKVTAP